MGITYSSDLPQPAPGATKEDVSLEVVVDKESESTEVQQQLHKTSLDSKQRLRLPFSIAEKLVASYNNHAFQPILDESSLRSLLTIAYSSGSSPRKIAASGGDEELDALMNAAWFIFQDHYTCFAQEVLVCIILLSDVAWNKRLSLMFDLFKIMGTEEMGHEEVQMAAQIVASALFRLWQVAPWPRDEIYSLTEQLADHCYLKVSHLFVNVVFTFDIYI